MQSVAQPSAPASSAHGFTIDPAQVAAGFDPHFEFYASTLLPSGELLTVWGYRSRAEAIEALMLEAD
jgi:hypothetical protein